MGLRVLGVRMTYSKITYSQLNDTLLACDSCGSIVWAWVRGTHDSWHQQMESAYENAKTLMELQTRHLED